MNGAGGAYFRLRLRLSGVISNGGGKKLFGDNLFKFSQIWQALKIHGQWSTTTELRRSIERNINSPLSGPNFIIIRNLLEIWHEEMFERQSLNINLTCRGVGQAPSPPLASSQTTSTKDQRTSSFQIGIFYLHLTSCHWTFFLGLNKNNGSTTWLLSRVRSNNITTWYLTYNMIWFVIIRWDPMNWNLIRI